MNDSAKRTEIEIAREALRRLVMEKKPPTPANYGEMYAAVAGYSVTAAFPEQALKKLHKNLPRRTPVQLDFAREIGEAIAKRSWDELDAALNNVLQPPETTQQNWPDLIRMLVQQLETHHVDLTAAKKKESVELVLSASAAPELLFSRLHALFRSWERVALADDSKLTVPGVTDVTLTQVSAMPAKSKPFAVQRPGQSGIVEVRQLIAQLLDDTLALILGDSPELVREAREISVVVRAANNAEVLTGIAERLKKLCYRAHFVVEDQVEISASLLHLVQLIVDNISELVVDDEWLAGQVSMVRELIMQPLDLRRMDEIERLLKDVIVKQSSLKKGLLESQGRLTQMLASFVDRLTDFSETTGDYHSKINNCAAKISKTKDLAELTEVLDEVMRETRAIQLNTARSRDELSLMQQRVKETESEVLRLRDELSQASQLVRHDSLTGALNRKGMDEALEKEVARQQRHGGTLSLALLDIDNFKKLNDTLGHAVGDDALVYLTRVVKEVIRPQDTLARYGGEEFVILLPDTSTEDAVMVMTRIQRGLTREFFMNNNEKALITFSCGVVEARSGEDPNETLKRADAAMYLAKRTGKNRVVPA